MNKKVIILNLIGIFSVFALAFLILIGMTAPTPSPKIFSIEPNELTEWLIASENTEIKVIGEGFGDNTHVYIDGEKVSEATKIDDNTISFVLSAGSLKKGNRSVQLTTDSGIFEKKSNVATLNIKAGPDIPAPTITKAEITLVNDNIFQVQVEGNHFSPDTGITVNGNIESTVVVKDSNHLTAKISALKYGLNDELKISSFAKTYTYLKSQDFALKIKPLISKKSHTSSTEYLKHGYLIAHAFGEFENTNYTNSLEAFKHNYKAGHRLFEVDFQLTSDNKLMGLHDRNTMIRTSAEEQQAVPFTLLSFENICQLMVENSDFYIITDTKYFDNMKAIKKTFDYMSKVIDEQYPQLKDRFVIQVYSQPMYYYLIENYDFSSYIYTLYASADTDEQVIEFVKESKIPVVTMPGGRATTTFINSLSELGAYTFVHTYNDNLSANSSLLNGVYGVYTDSLVYGDLTDEREARYEKVTRRINNQVLYGKNIFNDYLQYINNINGTDFTCILTINGTQIDKLPREIEEALRDLNLNFSLSQGTGKKYLAALRGKQVLADQFFDGEMEKSLTTSSVPIVIKDNSDDSDGVSIQVGGLNVAVNKAGLNLIIYDEKEKRLVLSINYNPDDFFAEEKKDAELFNARNNMLDFLDLINNEKYIVVMSVMDDGSRLIDDVLQNKLLSLGLKETLQGKSRQSYAAIIQNKQAVFEEISNDLIKHEVQLDEWLIDVQSAGFNSLNYSSIKVDGVEYSVNARGLNIVVINKQLGTVVDSLNIDTYGDLGVHRK